MIPNHTYNLGDSRRCFATRARVILLRSKIPSAESYKGIDIVRAGHHYFSDLTWEKLLADFRITYLNQQTFIVKMHTKNLD